MNYNKFEGQRISLGNAENSITFFFMSFVYPINSGWQLRMDFLIKWANLRFSTINFIINSNNWTKENIDNHLGYCNNLFVIASKKPKNRISKLLNILLSGRYPQFDSPLFLERSLGVNFGKVFNDYKTDYFFNTRINFGGLIKYISSGTICIIDTIDIFTDLHTKYSLRGRNKWLQFFLRGY